MIIKQAEFVQLLINYVHNVLWHHSVFQSLSELLFNGVLVFFFQAKFLLNDLQLLLEKVLSVGLLDLLFNLQNKNKIFASLKLYSKYSHTTR